MQISVSVGTILMQRCYLFMLVGLDTVSSPLWALFSAICCVLERSMCCLVMYNEQHTNNKFPFVCTLNILLKIPTFSMKSIKGLQS